MNYTTAQEIAKRLSLTYETVMRWARDGKIPAYKTGKNFLFNIEEVDRAIKAMKVKP